MVIIPILSYLPLLGMKSGEKLIQWIPKRLERMFRYKFYEFRLNSSKCIVNTHYLPLFTPIYQFRTLIPDGF